MSRAGAISDTLVSGLALPLGQGASGVSIAERRAVFTSLLEDDPAVPFPRDVVTRMRGEGLRSVLAIPLTGQTGEVYGALSVFYLQRRDFTPGDVELLSAFGTQASVAIENGRSFDALGRRARHDKKLHDFAQHLLQITAEDELRDETMRLTRDALGADVVGLFLFDVAGAVGRAAADAGPARPGRQAEGARHAPVRRRPRAQQSAVDDPDVSPAAAHQRRAARCGA